MRSLRRIQMELSSLTLRGKEYQRNHRRRRTLSPPTLKTRIPGKVMLTYCEPEEKELPSTQLIPPQVLAEALSIRFKRQTLLRLMSPLMTPSRPLLQTGSNFSKLSRKRSLTASLMLSYSVTITVLATRQKWLEKLGMGLGLRTLPVQLGATALFVAFARSMHQ
uniref:Uncharacterized protein n=1 Tax=Cherry green ring mottle virus TaxID=65467 RepID=A0A679G5V4_9VIRU|nr:hypothetical protein [Cherry green ring mottle virus]